MKPTNNKKKQARKIKPKTSKRAPNRGRQRNTQDIVTRAPVNLSVQVKGREAAFRVNARNLVVTHREFVVDVAAIDTGGFSQSIVFNINPGNRDVFPWLSAIARCYESYIIKYLQFEYKPSRATDFDGAILMAVDYDPADSDPFTKSELMANPTMTRANIWAPCRMNFKPKDAHKLGAQKFIRCGALDPNQDIKTYDVGKFYLYTTGASSPAIIGELYVNYTIELITPQLDDTTLANCYSLFATGNGLTKGNIFGPCVFRGGLDYAREEIRLKLPPGLYTIFLLVGGTGIANPTLTILDGQSTFELDYANTGAGSTTGTYSINWRISTGSTMEFDFDTSTTITSLAMKVSLFNTNLT